MKPHCRSCTCDPRTGSWLTVYPPNEILYGRCETCREVRHETESGPYRYPEAMKRSLHCGCCTHPHNLPPGGHDIPERTRNA